MEATDLLTKRPIDPVDPGMQKRMKLLTSPPIDPEVQKRNLLVTLTSPLIDPVDPEMQIMNLLTSPPIDPEAQKGDLLAMTSPRNPWTNLVFDPEAQKRNLLATLTSPLIDPVDPELTSPLIDPEMQIMNLLTSPPIDPEAQKGDLLAMTSPRNPWTNLVFDPEAQKRNLLATLTSPLIDPVDPELTSPLIDPVDPELTSPLIDPVDPELTSPLIDPVDPEMQKRMSLLTSPPVDPEAQKRDLLAMTSPRNPWTNLVFDPEAQKRNLLATFTSPRIDPDDPEMQKRMDILNQLTSPLIDLKTRMDLLTRLPIDPETKKRIYEEKRMYEEFIAALRKPSILMAEAGTLPEEDKIMLTDSELQKRMLTLEPDSVPTFGVSIGGYNCVAGKNVSVTACFSYWDTTLYWEIVEGPWKRRIAVNFASITGLELKSKEGHIAYLTVKVNKPPSLLVYQPKIYGWSKYVKDFTDGEVYRNLPPHCAVLKKGTVDENYAKLLNYVNYVNNKEEKQ